MSESKYHPSITSLLQYFLLVVLITGCGPALAIHPQSVPAPGAEVPDIPGLLSVEKLVDQFEVTQLQPVNPSGALAARLLKSSARQLGLQAPCPSLIRTAVRIQGPNFGDIGKPASFKLVVPDTMVLRPPVHWVPSSRLDSQVPTNGPALTFAYPISGAHQVQATADVSLLDGTVCSVGAFYTVQIRSDTPPIVVSIDCARSGELAAQREKRGDMVDFDCTGRVETAFSSLFWPRWDWSLSGHCLPSLTHETTCSVPNVPGSYSISAAYRVSGSIGECPPFGLCNAKGETVAEVFATTDIPENTGETLPPPVTPTAPPTTPEPPVLPVPAAEPSVCDLLRAAAALCAPAQPPTQGPGVD